MDKERAYVLGLMPHRMDYLMSRLRVLPNVRNRVQRGDVTAVIAYALPSTAQRAPVRVEHPLQSPTRRPMPRWDGKFDCWRTRSIRQA